MQLFVDFIDPAGRYRAARGADLADPAMPLQLLSAAVVLEAAAAGDRQPTCRLYHVEGARFLTAHSIGEAGLRDHDTVVVVNCERPRLRDPGAIELLWHAAGGLSRRLCLAGVAQPQTATAVH